MDYQYRQIAQHSLVQTPNKSISGRSGLHGMSSLVCLLIQHILHPPALGSALFLALDHSSLQKNNPCLKERSIIFNTKNNHKDGQYLCISSYMSSTVLGTVWSQTQLILKIVVGSRNNYCLYWDLWFVNHKALITFQRNTTSVVD